MRAWVRPVVAGVGVALVSWGCGTPRQAAWAPVMGEPVTGEGAGVAPPLPRARGKVVVRETIEVRGVFDGRGRMYEPRGLGSGGQGERQAPLFRLVEDGAVLRHVHLRGADGVHIEADDCRVEWCVNRDVGEDAVTVRGERAVVEFCWFRNARDKVVQVNRGSVVVRSCVAKHFGRFVRLNGGSRVPLAARMEGCLLYGGRGAAMKATDPGGRLEAYGNRCYDAAPGFQMFVVEGGAELREADNVVVGRGGGGGFLTRF